ncbi:prolipoprotein diacylglyceryl transferase [Candidatus Microgenomates bacterium]|nr:prolipoprotein diacylglyceryl transferase [Candidatus Microgenomates bacterium]
MYPILFSFGPITIYSLGFFLTLAFVFGSFCVWRFARDELDDEKILDAVIAATVFSVVGGRLFYIFWHFQVFNLNILRWIHFYLYPGFSFWGAIGGGILGVILYTRLTKTPFWRVADFLALGASLSVFLGQAGCFLDGCILGKPTNFIFGITPLGFLEKRHPISLYGLIVAIIIFLLLTKIIYKKTLGYRHKREGMVFLNFLLLLGFSSFLLEFFRVNAVYFYRLSLNQWIALISFIFSGSLLYLRYGNLKQDSAYLTLFLQKAVSNLNFKKKFMR